MEAIERRRHRVEVLATIVLAVAAVATAWSTYQSTQWRGQQAADNSKASAARIQSSQAARAGQLTQVEIATFTQWVNATVAGNTKLRALRQQEVLLALGVVILLGAAVFVATFPVMFVT